MDCNRFQQACRQARESLRGQNGIGTLGEKTLHAALKAYYEPDAESHEIKIGRYIADIVGENGIIEISPSSSHPDYAGIGDYIFRNNTIISKEAEGQRGYCS